MATLERKFWSYDQNQEIIVTIGFDPVFCRPFLVIEKTKYEDEEVDMYLYNNLQDEDCPYTKEYFIEKMKLHGAYDYFDDKDLAMFDE